jgi:hypothetical protein
MFIVTTNLGNHTTITRKTLGGSNSSIPARVFLVMDV